MKERILKNWTLTRVLFLILGISIMVQSILDLQWFGVLFGGYFASMGIFSFGCASGNCYGGNCAVPSKQTSDSTNQNIETNS
jgi:hypothetical protein